MLAKFDYGDYDVTLCGSYNVTKYKDSVLSSGVHNGDVYVREETYDSLEESLDFDPYERKKKRVRSGSSVGIFHPGDDYSDKFDGGFRLDAEIEFTNDSLIYHDATEKDCSGEITRLIVMLGDDKFLSFYGEYCIITERNSKDEFDLLNKTTGKNFDLIILTNS
jgi:hypothetical protein